MWQPGKRKKHNNEVQLQTSLGTSLEHVATWEKKETITRSSFRQIRIEKYIMPFASCYCQWKPDIFGPSRRYTPQKICASGIMSFILRYVLAALATTDVKSIISMLEIPVPDEIHKEDRNHGLA